MTTRSSHLLRLIKGASITLFAATSYPLLFPESSYNASKGDSLSKNDKIYLLAQSIAKKIGLQHADKLQVIVVNDDSTVASYGTSFQTGSQIFIPQRFYDILQSKKQYDYYPKINGFPVDKDTMLPSENEIKFAIAHEASHLFYNHSLKMTFFIPFLLFSSSFCFQYMANKMLAGIVSFGVLNWAAIALSIQMEYEADQRAANCGYLDCGLETFCNCIQRNCLFKKYTGSWFFTKNGNYLGDIWHPLLTSRLNQLQKLSDDISNHL